VLPLFNILSLTKIDPRVQKTISLRKLPFNFEGWCFFLNIGHQILERKNWSKRCKKNRESIRDATAELQVKILGHL